MFSQGLVKVAVFRFEFACISDSSSMPAGLGGLVSILGWNCLGAGPVGRRLWMTPSYADATSIDTNELSNDITASSEGCARTVAARRIRSSRAWACGLSASVRWAL